MVELLQHKVFDMIRSKECFKCKTIKPLTEFYKHKAMADGHLNKCKACTKSDVARHREDNIEKVREYDRQRAKTPERAKLNAEFTRFWRSEDSRRASAHNAVSRAVKTGELLRRSCEVCGSEKSLAHHDDYDNKLDVVWLCQPCHKVRHKAIAKVIRQYNEQLMSYMAYEAKAALKKSATKELT